MSVIETKAQELATELCEEIKNSEEYQEFAEARTSLQNDERANELMDIQQEARRKIQQGEGDRDEHLATLQEVDEKLDQLEVVQRYDEAESELSDYVESLNEQISEGLVIDFTSFNGGCC